jgi:beta-lactamase regulating signal transducer with metallopeptidase domain/HEAT repeat protein
LLIDAAAKATVVLLAAWLISLPLRRSSASLRAALWSAAFGALLALPLLIAALPAWRTPLLPERAWQLAPQRTPSPAASPTVPPPAAPAAAAGFSSPSALSSIEHAPQAGRVGVVPDESRRATDWLSLAPRIWLAGFLLVLAWYGVGQLRAWRMVRRARDAAPAWDELVHSLGARLGMRRRARVRYGEETSVPLTWGFRRDVILVPTTAEGWTRREREPVLLHELAHVRRRDCPLQLGSQLACAMYWFHPAIWYAAAQLRTERERACDDAVLTTGGDAHDYAAQLVRLARDARGFPSGAIAMARRSQLEGRLLSILDSRVDRRTTGRGTARRIGVAALALVAPLSALRPSGVTGMPLAPMVEAVPVMASAPPEASIGTPPPPPPPTPRATSPGDGMAGPPSPATIQAADSVIVAPNLAAPFAERWAWALREGARRGAEVWIGHGIITGDARTQGMISDSEQRSLDELLTQGPALGRILRDASGASPGDNAIVLLVRPATGELLRARVWTTTLNMRRDSRPLLWLGTVSDAESVAHLRALYDRASNDRLREALVEGVAIHDTESLVLPFLQQVLDGNASTDVREEAAEGLGFHDGNDSLRLLVTLARGDRSPEVRREAAEAIGMLRRPDAADTLVALAGTARDIEVRLEATEALGEVEDPRAEALLERIAFSDNHEDVLREAAEALGELDGAQGMAALEKVVRTHPRREVRAEGVESLAGKPERAVLPLLRWAAFEDSSERVQAEAIETLGEIASAGAREILRDVIQRHPSSRMRAEAEETLGDSR